MGNPPNHKKEKSEFTGIFEQFLKDYPEFPEIYEIVKKNSRGRGKYGKIGGGRIWIIGGFVYRPIIKTLYPELKVSEPSQIDIDFLIERGPGKKRMYLPEGWEPKITESGYFYLERGRIRLDLGYLFSFHSIRLVAGEIGSQPKFKYFFDATPLDIQSIAYDLDDKCVRGKPGIEAIKNKRVRINNLEEAKFEAEKRGVTLEDLVKQKAEEFGFDYDMTPIRPSNPPQNGPQQVKICH